VANKKITELTEAASAGVDDVLAVVDIATPETKKNKSKQPKDISQYTEIRCWFR
jgi:hypothetical protein